MSSAVPKQFLPLGGEPVISHSIRAFDFLDSITDIVVVCHEEYLGKMEDLLSGIPSKKIRGVVAGGETRQGSSFLGLKACPEGTEYVLIHDSARPFVSKRLVDDLLASARVNGAAGPVITLSDTVVELAGRVVSSVPERDNLRRIQTPQVFRYDLILRAHEEALQKGITAASDDCALVLVSGGRVGIVDGEEDNIKITGARDMALAEMILAGKTSRA